MRRHRDSQQREIMAQRQAQVSVCLQQLKPSGD
jgi:hypothetical protein